MSGLETVFEKAVSYCEDKVKDGFYKDFQECMKVLHDGGLEGAVRSLVYSKYLPEKYLEYYTDYKKLLWEPIIWDELTDAISGGPEGIGKHMADLVHFECVYEETYLKPTRCLEINGPERAVDLLNMKFLGIEHDYIRKRVLRNIFKSEEDVQKYEAAYADQWRRWYEYEKEIEKEENE